MRHASLVAIALCATGPPAQSTPVRDSLIEVADPELRATLETAAERGLEFLVRTQQENGSWAAHVGHKQEDDYWVFISAQQQVQRDQGHVGVTSLAGLALLAGGHLPGRGRFGEPVRRALDYVLAHVDENGFVTDSGSRMYSHAFATLFLAQVYGMVGEVRIRQGLERAVHWIVDCQNAQGAWRYNPFDRESDLSVTVCQVQALRAARNIGIRVPLDTIDRAVEYVMRSRTPAGRAEGLFYYKIVGRGAFRKNQEYAINAAAVTSLYSAGIHDAELTAPVLSFLEQDYPYLHAAHPNHFYFWYGNYYACQAFFQAGGDAFQRYYRRIAKDLLASQAMDGRWVNNVGPGDAFSTAVASIVLQIPRQYLPIFQR